MIVNYDHKTFILQATGAVVVTYKHLAHDPRARVPLVRIAMREGPLTCVRQEPAKARGG
jgi:hypothetical protein